MAGKNQHYIPQFILKKFGSRSKGKSSQVFLFEKGKETFKASTTGVAASRYFYSDLTEMGSQENLDAKITAFENEISQDWANFLANVSETPVDAEMSAKCLAHLAFRQALMRDVFYLAYKHALTNIIKIYSTKEGLISQLTAPTQNGVSVFRNELAQKFEPYSKELAIRNITTDDIENMGLEYIKNNINVFMAQVLSVFEKFLDKKFFDASSLLANAHNKVLSKSLYLEKHYEYLIKFQWSIRHFINTEFILPDCVSINFSKEFKPIPLALCDVDELDLVVTPLSSHSLLIGKKNAHSTCAIEISLLNTHFSKCCSRFFIAKSRTAEFETLKKNIGDAIEDLISSSFSQSNNQ